MKSQELFALLKRDRTSNETTTGQQIAYRMQAETVLGTGESLYKVEFVSVGLFRIAHVNPVSKKAMLIRSFPREI